MATTAASPTTGPPPLAERAEEWLARIAGPSAVLRDDQEAAIAALVDGRSVVNVQRTGAGKSAVYWVATALRRAAGAGPTLVVSPLLALMRDQVGAATRAGLAAATLNSANLDEWDAIEARLLGGELEVLLVSPERLNSFGFRERVLPTLGQRLGMLVIDEAHCISDWGNDFRPDYLRLRQLIAALPPGTPVLATTATANQRVTADIAEQVGDQTLTLRGPLDRTSLALSVVPTATTAEAYAWIADALPRFSGSGIVYTLTVAETTRLADFLSSRGLAVAAYSSGTDPDERGRLEQALLSGELTALVATSSLGMGYDHPSLSFVIHLGAPASPISYYQQVGRAGRALDSAAGVLLPTAADEPIWAYFDSTAMPPERVVRTVLGALGEGSRSVPAIEAATDVRRGRLETLLKILDVAGAVERTRDGYQLTGIAWHYDTQRYASVAASRRAEQQQMRSYLAGSSCLMRQLREALDDAAAQDCGRCSVCTGRLPEPGARPEPETVTAALAHLRSSTSVLEPRKMWPSGSGRRGRIPEHRRAEPGRALAFAEDPGWGTAVTAALATDGPLDDELLAGLVGVLRRWGWPAGRPTTVVALPSRRHPMLVANMAERLAEIGRMAVAHPLALASSAGFADDAPTSRASAESAISRLCLGPQAAGEEVPGGPVLLVDDYARSGFTLAVAADLLRDAGAGPVYPLVLHKRM